MDNLNVSRRLTGGDSGDPAARMRTVSWRACDRRTTGTVVGRQNHHDMHNSDVSWIDCDDSLSDPARMDHVSGDEFRCDRFAGDSPGVIE
jgi:hypothetical protein